MSSDIQGSKNIAIAFGLIAAGLLTIGVHQDNRWIIGGSIGLGAFTGLAWIGILDNEKKQVQRLHDALDLARLEQKPFSAKFFAGMFNIDIETAEKFLNKEVAANGINSKDVDMEDGTALYIFPISQNRRFELEILKAKREEEDAIQRKAEKAVSNTVAIGTAAVGLAVLSMFLGGD